MILHEPKHTPWCLHARGTIRWSTCLQCLHLASLVAALAGCSKSSISQLRTNSPDAAAGLALDLYDANRDGKISQDELAKSLSLVDGRSRIDSNNDHAIDRAELVARFQKHDQMSDAVSFSLQVLNKGAPMSGATVTYVPEPFMGEGKQSYVGTVADNGFCTLEGEQAHMPGGSVPTGFYKVHIVDQASGIDIERGIEVADDSPTANRVMFDAAIEPSVKPRPR